MHRAFDVLIILQYALSLVSYILNIRISKYHSTIVKIHRYSQCAGIPKWLDPAGNSDEGRGEEAKGEEKKIGLSGLAQLITAGMGSPFLGDFEGVDEETGKMMFSLEANNLVDEDGKSKQTSMPYFESGWVDPKDLEKERQKKENGSGGFKFW